MSSTTDDDQPTIRLTPEWYARAVTAEADRPDEGEAEPRRRVEVGALVFGSLLAGILAAALWVWSHDDDYPHAQTEAFIFMALTSGAVLGIFVSAFAAYSRQTKATIRRAVKAEAELHAQTGLAMLRTVAFQINDNRAAFNAHAERIFALVADALERGGFASAAEVAELRSRVDTMAAAARSTVAEGPDELQIYLRARADVEEDRRRREDGDGGDRR